MSLLRFACLLSFLGLAGSAVLRCEVLHLGSNPWTGSAEAVVVAGSALAHTSQVLPWDDAGKIDGPGDPKAQISRVFDNLDKALAEAGSGLPQVVKLNIYLRRSDLSKAVIEALEERFPGAAKPAVSFVESGLAHPNALVAMDAVASTAPRAAAAPVERNRSPRLPGPPGASHAAVLPLGSRVYISGKAAREGDTAQAALATLKQLQDVLEFLGLGLSHVVQVKSFLRPVSAIPEVEKQIIEFFGSHAPPMIFVEWKNNNPIEIELIAMSGPPAADAPPGVIEYVTPPGENASPVFSRVARLHHPKTIYISGLFGETPKDGERQIREIFAVLKRIAQQTGSDLKHLAKATYYVTHDEVSRQLNEIRPEFYDPKRPPAASKAAAAGTGLPGRTVTLDMIAVPVK